MVMGEGFLIITVQGLKTMSLIAGQFSWSALVTTHLQPEAWLGQAFVILFLLFHINIKSTLAKPRKLNFSFLILQLAKAPALGSFLTQYFLFIIYT